MVKSEPKAPAVVVKRDWKGEGNYQQQGNHQLVISTDHRHGHEIDKQDREFGRNNID